MLTPQFNSGAAHPTSDSSPETVAAGLEATAEIMQRTASMSHLAVRRALLVSAASAPYYQLTQQALQVRARLCATGTAHCPCTRGWPPMMHAMNGNQFCCPPPRFNQGHQITHIMLYPRLMRRIRLHSGCNLRYFLAFQAIRQLPTHGYLTGCCHISERYTFSLRYVNAPVQCRVIIGMAGGDEGLMAVNPMI